MMHNKLKISINLQNYFMLNFHSTFQTFLLNACDILNGWAMVRCSVLRRRKILKQLLYRLRYNAHTLCLCAGVDQIKIFKLIQNLTHSMT